VTKIAILVLIPLTVVVLAVVWLVAALTWDPQPDERTIPAGISITADGSPVGAPYLQSVARALRTRGESDVSVDFGASGTAAGLGRLCAGGIDIAAASRPIGAAERAACRRAGLRFETFRVASRGLVLVTRRDADVGGANLTRPQLRAIWSAGSTIERWSEVPGGRFADRPLALVGPSSPPSHDDILGERVLRGDPPRRPRIVAEDDGMAIDAVEHAEAGLAAIGFAAFGRHEDALRAFAVDGVAPTPQTIASRRYPLAHPLILYVPRDAFGREEIRIFLARALRDGAGFASESGLVPAPAAVLAEGWQRVNEVSNEVARRRGSQLG
jgi:phosphate transport system substrate-binding protein